MFIPAGAVVAVGWGMGLGGMEVGVAKDAMGVGLGGMEVGVARGAMGVGLGGMEIGRLQPTKSRTEMTTEAKIE